MRTPTQAQGTGSELPYLSSFLEDLNANLGDYVRITIPLSKANGYLLYDEASHAKPCRRPGERRSAPGQDLRSWRPTCTGSGHGNVGPAVEGPG